MPIRRSAVRAFQPELIADFLDGRNVTSSKLLERGRRNSNYRICLDDGLVCVARLYAEGGPEPELGPLQLARQVVPVPEVFARGADWAILSFLDGRPLVDSPGATQAAARMIGKLRSVRFSQQGWIGADLVVRPFAFGGSLGFVNSKLESTPVAEHLGPELYASLRAFVVKATDSFEALDVGPCLVHGDFNPSNVLTREGRVSGLVDWEFSHAGSSWLDIGNLLRHTSSDRQGRIEAGLREAGMEMPANWRENARLADLSAHLEFLDSDSSPARIGCSVRWIGSLVKASSRHG